MLALKSELAACLRTYSAHPGGQIGHNALPTLFHLRQHQLPIGALMDRLHIPRAALDDPELRISLPAYAQLLEVASKLSRCPDLGLRIAGRQDISILGPLAIAMQNASTVGEAAQTCSRFLHTHSNGIRVSFRPDTPVTGQTTLRMTLVMPRNQPGRQLMDLCLKDLHHFLTVLDPGHAPVTHICLPHAPKAPVDCYTRSFGQPVTFQAPHAEIVVPTSFLDQDLAGAVPELHDISLQYLKLTFSSDSQPVREQVESILQQALSSTRGRREVVARLLHMHPRTLQRRLRAEGTSFSELVEGVRREQAGHWLTESNVPLAYIADILGLADQAVLSRCCRRWFGRPPAAVRKQGLAAANSD